VEAKRIALSGSWPVKLMVLVQITFPTEELSSSVQGFARYGDDKAMPQYNNKAGTIWGIRPANKPKGAF